MGSGGDVGFRTVSVTSFMSSVILINLNDRSPTNGNLVNLLVYSNEPFRHDHDGAIADIGGHHSFIRRILDEPQEPSVLPWCLQVPNVCFAIGSAAYEDFGILQQVQIDARFPI